MTELTNFSYEFNENLKINDSRLHQYDSDDDLERNEEVTAH